MASLIQLPKKAGSTTMRRRKKNFGYQPPSMTHGGVYVHVVTSGILNNATRCTEGMPAMASLIQLPKKAGSTGMDRRRKNTG